VRLRKLRRLSELSPNEWLFLAQLVLFILMWGVAVRLVALPHLMGFMARCVGNRWLGRFPVYHRYYEVAHLARLADMAARVTHGQGRCLGRSLLLFWLLKARGEPAELLIGISKAAGTLRSHAWIELRRRVIGDHPQIIRRFAILLRF
jgi:Transglutaminase-like superfamily